MARNRRGASVGRTGEGCAFRIRGSSVARHATFIERKMARAVPPALWRQYDTLQPSRRKMVCYASTRRAHACRRGRRQVRYARALRAARRDIVDRDAPCACRMRRIQHGNHDGARRRSALPRQCYGHTADFHVATIFPLIADYSASCFVIAAALYSTTFCYSTDCRCCFDARRAARCRAAPFYSLLLILMLPPDAAIRC